MVSLTKPSENFLRTFLDKQQHENFSYPEIGATQYSAPLNYNVDHNRIQIGNGRKDFEKAVEAVKTWKMFDISWIQIYPPCLPPEVGENVVVLAKHLGFWSLNVSRIVYLIDEEGTVEKYGFAYGTLDEHGERGEERFSVEFHHSNQEVWYDLFAFSKPNHILAKIGYPFSRHFQKQFAAESKEAMFRFVNSR